MATKEEEFKQRFAGILLDLMTSEDVEDRVLLGGLAARLIDAANKPNWTQFRQTLTAVDYSSLLTTFQNHGNRLAKEGQRRQVYAIEVLAVSLVSKTQTDPEVVESAATLNQIIDDAIVIFRDSKSAGPVIN